MIKYIHLAAFFLFAPVLKAQEGFQRAEGIFFDSARDREIPYIMFFPNDSILSEYPVILSSHGLGGSTSAMDYLGKYLAEHHYITVHIQHAGSDEELLTDATTEEAAQEQLERSLKNHRNAIHRFKDIPFVIDQIVKLNGDSSRYKGIFDTSRIGMMGHSYGAKSVMIAAGERLPVFGTKLKEDRIKAAVALSPSIPDRTSSNWEKVFDEVKIPIFHITGTKDHSTLNPEAAIESRQIPYRNICSSDQYLLILNEAVHHTFSGNAKAKTDDPLFDSHLQSIRMGVLSFFDTYLKDDPQCRIWLMESYKNILAAEDHFEWSLGN